MLYQSKTTNIFYILLCIGIFFVSGLASANNAPTASGTIAAQTVNLNGAAATVNVFPNFNDDFSDADDYTLTYTASSSDDTKATVSVSSSTVTITAVAVGTATITVTATDSGGLSATQTFSVTIVNVPNSAPVITSTLPDSTATIGETPVTIDPADYFSDPDGNTLSYRWDFSESEIGVWARSTENGMTITYDKVGVIKLTLTVIDSWGLSVSQSCTITMVVGSGPVVTVGTIPRQRVNVGGAAATVDVSSDFSHADDDTLTYTASSSDTTKATVSVSGSTVSITGVAVGTSTIRVTATDTDNSTATQMFLVIVSPPNRPAAVGTIPNQTVNVGGTAATVDVSSYFRYREGDTLTYTASSSDTAKATVSVSGATVTITGVVAGTSTITVTATASDDSTATQTFSVTVVQPNPAPVTVDAIPAQQSEPDTAASTRQPSTQPEQQSEPDAGAIPPQTVVQPNPAPAAVGTISAQTVNVGGAAATVDVSSNFSDTDSDTLTYTASSSDTTKATVSVSGATVTITGVAAGTATITVTATDPGSLTATQTFSVTVVQPNPAPVAVDAIPAQQPSPPPAQQSEPDAGASTQQPSPPPAQQSEPDAGASAQQPSPPPAQQSEPDAGASTQQPSPPPEQQSEPDAGANAPESTTPPAQQPPPPPDEGAQQPTTPPAQPPDSTEGQQQAAQVTTPPVQPPANNQNSGGGGSGGQVQSTAEPPEPVNHTVQPFDYEAEGVGKIVFSEWMLSRLNNAPQWIEVYNTTDEDINLRGWQIVGRYMDGNDDVHLLESHTLKSLIVQAKETRVIAAHSASAGGGSYSESMRDKVYLLESSKRLWPGKAIVLELQDSQGNPIDRLGSLNEEDEITWHIPYSTRDNVNKGRRVSLIRRLKSVTSRDYNFRFGMTAFGWFPANEVEKLTESKRSEHFYGHPTDVGAPGYRTAGADPLPVTLSSFIPEIAESGQVVLSWTTASEFENAGFNILRSESVAGSFTKINARLIQGAGTTSERNAYTWIDTTAQPNVEYYYRIEDMSFDGISEVVATQRLKGLFTAKNRTLTRWATLKKAVE